MMSPRFLFSTAALLTSAWSFAALPPFYQSTREIKALLTHDGVKKEMKDEKIYQIKRVKKGYLLASKNCKLEARMDYLPQPDGFAGPAQFKFTLGKCQANKSASVARLPKAYDPKEEIFAVLRSGAVLSQFNYRSLQFVRRTPKGFELKSRKCSLKIRVSHDSPSGEGSAGVAPKFSLEVGTLKCKKKTENLPKEQPKQKEL